MHALSHCQPSLSTFHCPRPAACHSLHTAHWPLPPIASQAAALLARTESKKLTAWGKATAEANRHRYDASARWALYEETFERAEAGEAGQYGACVGQLQLAAAASAQASQAAAAIDSASAAVGLRQVKRVDSGLAASSQPPSSKHA